MKVFFKKYGPILGAFATIGAIIGAILGPILSSIKKLGKGLGDGLKTIGKKTANLLPGLLGAIVSFAFRAAGSAISFLAKNAWLLVAAVAVFLIERLKKRNE